LNALGAIYLCAVLEWEECKSIPAFILLALGSFILNLQSALLMLPGLILGFTVHEFAHAYTAVCLGDPTPKQLGRITLNPIVHIDWIGLLLILFAGFGWAKPVVYNPANLKNPTRDGVLISLAGPLANLVLALLLLPLFWFLIPVYYSSQAYWLEILVITVQVAIKLNIMLFIFNLLPIPPLDGSHILLAALPDSLMNVKVFITQYGSWVLIALIMIGNFANRDIIPVNAMTNTLFNFFNSFNPLTSF